MVSAPEALPDDVAALKAALIAERARRQEVAAELAIARAKASEDMALIAARKLRIARLERQVFGQRSERLIDQLALAFEALEASATEDELAAEQAAARTTTVRAFTRRRAERDTFPDHLPRERVVIDPPTACACCGGARLRKLGEDVTRTLETTPRRWKDRDGAGEGLVPGLRKDQPGAGAVPCGPEGMGGPEPAGDDRVREPKVREANFGQHQPLNRQAERHALEGAPIALSTMADAVGAVAMALDPLRRMVEAHVMAAERLHGDDTTVPVLTQGKTDTGRLWIYLWTVPAMQGLLRQFWQTLGCSYLFGLCRNVVADLDEMRGLAPNYVGGLSEPDRSSGFSQFRSDRIAIITPIALAQPKLWMRGYEAVARSVDMTAHAIRAVLFASATVATLKCRRPKRPEIQALCT